MPTLQISSIKKDGEDRLALAKQAMDFEKIVARLYPGATVCISFPDEASEAGKTEEKEFKALSVSEQIAAVMKQQGAAMEKASILKAIEARGGKVGTETLTSYLSRYKKLFKNAGRGQWELVSKTPTNGQHEML